jgi:hypothetical protein
VTSVVAQEDDADIHACVARGGAVRIVAAGEPSKTAPSSQVETPLSWPSTDTDTDTGTHLDFAGTVQLGPEERVIQPGTAVTFKMTCGPGALLVRGSLSFVGVLGDARIAHDVAEFSFEDQKWIWTVEAVNLSDTGTAMFKRTGYCVPVQ